MRVIIAGSRTITDFNDVYDAIVESGWRHDIETVISGGAKGPDTLGELWAERNNVSIEVFHANWNKYGKSAGYKRNQDMAMVADAVIAVWDGESKGTKHMIDIANELGLEVFIWRVK